jgi:hypothetical protein
MKLSQLKPQNKLILDTLISRGGSWVSLPALMRIAKSAAVHSRINDLRHAGYFIENKIRGYRPRKSWYRLVA